MRLALFLCLLMGLPAPGNEQGASAGSPLLPRLLVLDPVDLDSNANSLEIGRAFRQVFARKDVWKIITRSQMKEKFQAYNKDIRKPCKELDCAFDAGSILQAKYSLFSTVNHFENYYIFSLNLIDISITRVIWSEVGEIPIKSGVNPSEALVHRVKQLASEINPDKFSKTRMETKGTLGILNVSTPGSHAKILFERLSAQAYSSGQYDVVGQSELQFMLESLETDLSGIKTASESLISLGERLGVDYLIHFNLVREESQFKLELAMYDIQQKRLMRKWPYQNKNFRKLLRFEDKFFAKLNNPDQPATVKKKKKSRFKLKWAAASALVVAGSVMGYLAYDEHKQGDEMYDVWDSADTGPEIEENPVLEAKIKDSRMRRNLWGALGGLAVAGSLVVLRF